MQKMLTLFLFHLTFTALKADYTVDFESVALPPEQYLPSATIEGLTIESTAPWGASYSVSSKTSLQNVNLYWQNGDDSVVSSGGANQSEQWLAAYNFTVGDFILAAPQSTVVSSITINNTALVGHTVVNGLFQASSFTQGDFLRVRFIALNASNQTIGTTNWYDLAIHDGNLWLMSQWTTIDLSSLQSNRITFEFAGSDVDPLFGLNTPSYLAIDNVVIDEVTQPASVVDSFIYHAGWTGSGASRDFGKSLAPEENGPQTLGFQNLINTTHGINGIVFDFQNLSNVAGLSVNDFRFQWSPPGAFDPDDHPGINWQDAPAPTITDMQLSGSTDRIELQWTNNQIRNRWLRITIRATGNTGLTEDQVYYVGHLQGEVDGSLSSGVYVVQYAAEVTLIRAAVATITNASSILDIDKNGQVRLADIVAMRSNVAVQLTNISIP